jgi:hypothetical protein
VRPTRILPGTKSPLEGCKIGDLDWMIIRENSEGEYSGQGGISHGETEHAVATEVSIVCVTSLSLSVYFHLLLKEGQGCLPSQHFKSADRWVKDGGCVAPQHQPHPMPQLYILRGFTRSTTHSHIILHYFRTKPQLTPHSSSPKLPSRESSTSPSLPHVPARANT